VPLPVMTARFTRKPDDSAKLPSSAVAVLFSGAGITLALAVAWFVIGDLGTTSTLVVTGLLALVCGAQAAAVRHIGIRDLSTVVVTMTMVNLSADSRLAGGQGAGWLRRVAAILAMGLGALLAAALVLHVNGASALLAAGILMTAGVGLLTRARFHESVTSRV
jgi:uncharacterized membrane protein YoaK (UPF0700 family)